MNNSMTASRKNRSDIPAEAAEFLPAAGAAAPYSACCMRREDGLYFAQHADGTFYYTADVAGAARFETFASMSAFRQNVPEKEYDLWHPVAETAAWPARPGNSAKGRAPVYRNTELAIRDIAQNLAACRDTDRKIRSLSLLDIETLLGGTEQDGTIGDPETLEKHNLYQSALRTAGARREEALEGLYAGVHDFVYCIVGMVRSEEADTETESEDGFPFSDN